ncbi:hypothetical protein GGQ62_001764 [Polymorphobacter fuscus]|nr:hypothetical protein [Polymorphobacter fuscus]
MMGTTLFEDFESYAVGASYGGGAQVFAPPSTPGFAAVPAFGSSDNYLGVQNNLNPAGNVVSSATIGIPGMQVLSFVIGSLDTYNQVILHFASGGSMQLDGYQIVGQGPNFLDGISGDQLIAATNGRVFFDTQGLDTITGFELRSLGANAFEIDNISIAAPEPATWGMMILAAGMAGVALRRRRTRPAMA